MISLRKIVGAARFWASPPIPGTTELIGLLAQRAADVAPDSVEVVAEEAGITIVGGGSSGYRRETILLGLAMRTALGPHESLELAIKMFSAGLQNALTDAVGEPWPTSAAPSHFCITTDRIAVWWGGSSEDEAVVRLRPIVRHELPVRWR